MASSMPQLDQSPPQPPGVMSQMGAPDPYSGVSQMLAQKNAPQGGGGANPKGALAAQAEAIKKVLDQMAKMETGFGPFADRIKSLLDAGIGTAMSGGPQPNSSAGQPPSVQGPVASNRPGDQGAAAPGAGFPG